MYAALVKISPKHEDACVRFPTERASKLEEAVIVSVR
jgi:hypothetical protein